MDERLEYYKQKYGEDFAVSEGSRSGTSGKPRSGNGQKRKAGSPAPQNAGAQNAGAQNAVRRNAGAQNAGAENSARRNAKGNRSSPPGQPSKPEQAPAAQAEKGLFGKLRRIFGGDRK